MNENPEQLVRDHIDIALIKSGWLIQNKNQINLNSGLGVAEWEYKTDIRPADYVLFVYNKTVGVIEAKRTKERVHLRLHQEQTACYAVAKLKYLNNEMLRFLYESTGHITRFTNYQYPKPRARPLFSFYRPENILNWARHLKSLRERLKDILALPQTEVRDCQILAINNLEKSFRREDMVLMSPL